MTLEINTNEMIDDLFLKYCAEEDLPINGSTFEEFQKNLED